MVVILMKKLNITKKSPSKEEGLFLV